MIQERNFPTFLKKLTPAPKMWFALGLILVNLLVKNWYLSLAILIISVAMIVKGRQMALFALIGITMVIMGISLYGIHGAMAPIIDKAVDVPMFTIAGIRYYAKGFAYATRYFMRTMPLMAALFLIFTSIDTADLGATMCNAGIPYKGVFTFIDSFQVIILLKKDMEQITDAQRARGLNTEGNLLQRLKAFVPIIVPVVAGSIVKVQDQAIAMDTKGFNSTGKKTVYRELTPYKWDPTVKWTGIAMSVFAIGYTVLVTLKVIPAFLTNII